MTREELIRNLKYTMEKHKNDTVHTFGTNISVMCKDILDYLEKEGSWIPVNKKLPGDEEDYDDEEDYLVTDADGNCAVGYYRKDCDAWDSSEFGWLEHQTDPSYPYIVSGIGKVVAWMPLPEKYKIENEG